MVGLAAVGLGDWGVVWGMIRGGGLPLIGLDLHPVSRDLSGANQVVIGVCVGY